MSMVNSGNGSRVLTATGSFSVGSGYITSKQIEHNLGTTKVFGMVWVEPNANNEVVTSNGYQVIFGTFCTYQKFNEVLSGATLVCNYTSSSTKTYEIPQKDIRGGLLDKSNWTASPASFVEQRVDNIWATANTENIITINTNTQNTYLRTGLIYHWQIWALE